MDVIPLMLCNAHYNAQIKPFVLKYALRNALSDGCYQQSIWYDIHPILTSHTNITVHGGNESNSPLPEAVQSSLSALASPVRSGWFCEHSQWRSPSTEPSIPHCDSKIQEKHSKSLTITNNTPAKRQPKIAAKISTIIYTSISGSVMSNIVLGQGDAESA